MKSNVIQFEPSAAAGSAPDQAEPLEEAVREVSKRVATLNNKRRRLFKRLDELRGLTPGLRRRRSRPSPPALAAPVAFFSIEEAAADREALSA